jgi:hypothetical protein
MSAAVQQHGAHPLRDSIAGIARHCWRGGIWVKRSGHKPEHKKRPLTFEHLDAHADGSGPAIGLAPIVPGTSTTRVGLLDFDDHAEEMEWSVLCAKVARVVAVLRARGCDPLIFRSRSGTGVHVYIFFEEPVEARDVREFLRLTLEECGLKVGTKGVAKGEAEAFPKQNSVSPGGAGNMFILAYAGKSELLRERLTGEGLISAGRVPFDIPYSPPLPKAPPPPERVKSSAPVDASFERVKSALYAIDPNTLGYDEWLDILYAVLNATGGSEEGVELMKQWGSAYPRHSDEFVEAEWRRADPDRDGGITASTLFSAARARDWIDPAILDDFDIITDEDVAHLEAANEAKAQVKIEVAKKKFTPITAADFRKRPYADWIVKGIVPHGFIVVYGEPGSGKTFLMMDLAAAVALCEDWCGGRVKGGRVVYVAAEGAGGVRNRADALMIERDLAELDVLFIAVAPNLLDKGDVGGLIEALRECGPVRLVILDTWARVTAGGSENDGKDMSRAIEHCAAIQAATGAAVAVVHHSGKDASKGARGWSGLRGAVDCEIEVTRNGDERAFKISKQKDGEDGFARGFRLIPREIGRDEDDDPITSCVVEHLGHATKARGKKRAPGGTYPKHVWAVLNDLVGLAVDDGWVDFHSLIEECYERMGPSESNGRDRRPEYLRRALIELQNQGFVEITGGRVRVSE